ncbi:bifunctional adenosylcobinamide kinase/adenosylcobinamide-phosphate guanylyltransferase [Alkalihalobacillus sp. CinArs1]|uniref:bifunctional adenosylcobinamide kinase/adenosylcobinamide-phosphate guanylyltransferase n=1 Tax=Alkalihalobacillus sp. CinArs1 TaxID=2995314 RepID=UPI0022DE189B|nr:bifunctional adenosylcobinamide kinase/adenosylcobinamide-phosphate guanylyltransferase [Alkalihalobacillus sp. CinArs1]
MHVVTGGAFNGKSKWVRDYYGVPLEWYSAYDGTSWDEKSFKKDVVVLEGLEEWIKTLVSDQKSLKETRRAVRSYIEAWSAWESGRDERTIIVIGTDIMKGIVPLEKEKRMWRDVVGWAYQDLVSLAERVDVIWYGLNQQLK